MVLSSILPGIDTTAEDSLTDLAVLGHQQAAVMTLHLPIQGEPVGGWRALSPYGSTPIA
jgi:hypothetical protein